ncbi:uncharacterized protein LOC116773273 [Danaus plexippus]|nr:uncharacterized protein LOC116773273 [Danaus plexippus]
MYLISLCAVFCSFGPIFVVPFINCRDRNNHLRHDGGLCFEIPSWQLQTVEVDHHLDNIRNTFANSSMGRRLNRQDKVSLANREVKTYVDTVIAPFLDTYHINIQNSYQQLTNKIVKRIKDEINAALRKKQKIYTELTNLADSLKVPAMCNEERRAALTLASKHVSLIYKCTEQAKESISKMGKYAEEMISITRRHMEFALHEVGKKLSDKSISRSNVTSSLKELSRAAALLGYELDLSLTNARRHNEQSCEKLSNCSIKARRFSEDSVRKLKEFMYQCVYA